MLATMTLKGMHFHAFHGALEVERELGQVLGDQGDQTGVVRTRRNFTEPHLVALDEQLHTEQATTTEGPAAGAATRLTLLGEVANEYQFRVTSF